MRLSAAFPRCARIALSVLLAGLPLWVAHADEPVEPDARASEPREYLREAIEVYSQALDEEQRDLQLAKFRRAERMFARATEAGIESAELYVNLGNAALQGERLGPAIVAYRRALVLDPTLQTAQQNLEHSRSLMPSWVPTPKAGGVFDTFFFWHETLSRDTRATAAALCFALACVLIAVTMLLRSSLSGYLAALSGLAWAALSLSLLLDPATRAEREGVIVANEAVARAADSQNAPVLFGDPLPSGTELEVLDDRGNWLQIRLANGRTAWVNAATVGRVAGL